MGQQHKIHSTRVQMSPKGESRNTSDQSQSLIQHRSQSRCGKQHSCNTRPCNDMGDVRRSGKQLFISHRAHRAGMVRRRKFSDAQQVLQFALTLCPRSSTASFHPLSFQRPWRFARNFPLRLASRARILARHVLGNNAFTRWVCKDKTPHKLRVITQLLHACFPFSVLQILIQHRLLVFLTLGKTEFSLFDTCSTTS